MMPNVPVPLWVLVTTPVVTVLGTMLAVMLAAVYQNRGVDRMAEALRAEINGLRVEVNAIQLGLRAEMRQGFAELRLEFHKGLSELTKRIERLGEFRGLVRP